MKRHIGIVLKKNSSRQDTFSVFDRHDGRVVCIAKGLELSVGSLISYFFLRPVSRRVITEVQVLDIPLLIARTDIFFLHHVFELCHYFLPIYSVAIETFDLVMLLYTCSDKIASLLKKKIFLFKLLISFGFYSDHMPFSLATFSRLSSESIDSIVNSSLHLEIERNIDEWLFLCVGAHPQFASFKTVQFFKKIGCYEKI